MLSLSLASIFILIFWPILKTLKSDHHDTASHNPCWTIISLWFERCFLENSFFKKRSQQEDFHSMLNMMSMRGSSRFSSEDLEDDNKKTGDRNEEKMMDGGNKSKREVNEMSFCSSDFKKTQEKMKKKTWTHYLINLFSPKDNEEGFRFTNNSSDSDQQHRLSALRGNHRNRTSSYDDERRKYLTSTSSMSSPSSRSSSNKLPPENPIDPSAITLPLVLSHPSSFKAFMDFLQKEYNSEPILFWMRFFIY